MCGIAVAIDWDDAEATVRRLIGHIAHRGDISDPVVSPSARTAMATRRLGIVDAPHATQPTLSHDGRFLVAFNGEIYNHDVLRAELAQEGVTFQTRSDTEILASALSHWGVGALHRFNGMYAFVALDLRSGAFLAARDPFGVKPLYFIMSDTGFLFCSEIRPLLACAESGDVMLLPPGHHLTRRDCAPHADLRTPPTHAAVRADTRQLDNLLAAAVATRMPPDLPVALMFSGGIDSTLVAHYALQTRATVPGYFLGGADAPDYPYAVDYADRSGLDLRLVGFDDGDQDAALDIGAVVSSLETFEPDIVRNGLCTLLLSRRIHADGFRVALTGEGADELFAGYPTLELAFADSDEAGRFVRDQHIANMHRTCLQRLDRCSMRFQLEAREPFLDPSVAGFALGLAAGALVEIGPAGPKGKAPLRAIYDLYPDRLPPRIRHRTKVPLNQGSGFDPDRPGQTPWGLFADETLSDADLRDGQRRYADFDLRSKQELLYIESLAASMDIARVPHLKARNRLSFPNVKNREALRPYMLDA